MAAAKVTLDDARRDAGCQLLKLTDLVGFDVTSAGWGYTQRTSRWQFYLFTELVDTKGPLWIWDRLLKAFNKLSLPDAMTALDIVVASPNEHFYNSLPPRLGGVEAPGMEAAVETGHIDPFGHGLDYLWLLRSRPVAASENGTTRQNNLARRFDMKVRQLMAA